MPCGVYSRRLRITDYPFTTLKQSRSCLIFKPAGTQYVRFGDHSGINAHKRVAAPAYFIRLTALFDLHTSHIGVDSKPPRITPSALQVGLNSCYALQGWIFFRIQFAKSASGKLPEATDSMVSVAFACVAFSR